MISHGKIRGAITSLVVFALIIDTVGCSEEKDSRQEEQKRVNDRRSQGQPVYIRDPALLSLVRQTVGTEREFVTDTEISMLQELIVAPYELHVDRVRIDDLEGLEHAIGLTHLDLSGRRWNDGTTPIVYQTRYGVDSFVIENISYNSTIDSYDYAYYDGDVRNDISMDEAINDIRPLAGLTNLRHLYLSNSYIYLPERGHPLAALEGLTNLETLDLSSPNFGYELTPLAGLTNLRHLYLSDFDNLDLTPLAGLTNLETLDLAYSSFARGTDLTPLAGLSNLRRLYLTHSDLRNITPLAGLTNLEELYLSHTRLYAFSIDITPLAGLTNLKILNLQDNIKGYSNARIDITPLAGLTNLEHLDVSDNGIEDITPLAGLTNLKILDLNGNVLTNLTPLAGLTNLKILNLDNAVPLTSIYGTDIKPLAGLTNLRFLSLHDNVVSDLTPLEGLTNLEHLEIDVVNQPVDALTPLAGLTNLKILDIQIGGFLPDLTPLAGLTNLEFLGLHLDKGFLDRRGVDIVDLTRPLCELKTTTIDINVELDCK